MNVLDLNIHLRVVGVMLLGLAMLNLFVPKRFGWPGELQRLSLLTRQVFVVHCVFIILMLVMMGVLAAVYAPLLLGGTPLASVVLAGLAVFWILRLVMQFFYYSPKLWRGNRFNTVMHVVFSWVWIYFSAVFAGAWWVSVR